MSLNYSIAMMGNPLKKELLDLSLRFERLKSIRRLFFIDNLTAKVAGYVRDMDPSGAGL